MFITLFILEFGAFRNVIRMPLGVTCSGGGRLASWLGVKKGWWWGMGVVFALVEPNLP